MTTYSGMIRIVCIERYSDPSRPTEISRQKMT